MGKTSLLALAALVALVAAPGARAAELAIFATGSMADPLKQLGAEYSAKSGDTLSFTVGPTGVVQNRLRAGEKADVIVISAEGADPLQKEGVFLTGTRIDLARSLFGVAVRQGAPEPDISTPEAFKKTVLAARSISYPDPAVGAVSGIYLESLFQRLGIAAEAKQKTVVKPVGAQVAEAVAKGEVELGLSFISEFIPNKGVKLVGPFPAAIQNPTLFVAAIAAKSENRDAARAFLAFVTSPAARTQLKAAGVEPVGVQ